VAVGNDSACRSTRESFLAVGCPACGLVYLNPRPAPEARPRLYPASYFTRREPVGERIAAAAVKRAIRELRPRSPAARVLEVGYGPRLLFASRRNLLTRSSGVEALTAHPAVAGEASASGVTVHHGEVRSLDPARPGYDLVLLFRALEHWNSPVEELTHVGRLLAEDGRVLVLTPNPASAVGRVFRGRHWAGYDFPRHACLFGPAAMRRLAGTAGLELERLGTLDDGSVWAESAAALLRDWEAPGWLVRTGPALLALAGRMAALPRPGRRDAGAWLEAVLRKPGTPA